MRPCDLCGRPELTTRHHLFPRSLHRRLKRKKDARAQDLREIVDLCAPCHIRIHQIFSEKELASEYNSLERLLADTRVQNWLCWIRRKPSGFRPRTNSWKARRG
ncbi:hypothetical protein V6C53_10910 [Desulfocurvibacter africanus]|uniref:HNH domain-containing protein n=2 Tax=Desulfocurvibacter africanus TaxID=873 RepID=F3YXB7_DESAF|nr:hypothetical protein [Desulfocurvibacter africanus]EGJ50615.1 hypothetical protein Desaf_2289 [Desulfocurvibacter africanus subsp. africanus str. Walvis Bay]EMG37003.1 hypothetical protein PCS_02140 [Desulfocurvibacter africanus PCS]